MHFVFSDMHSSVGSRFREGEDFNFSYFVRKNNQDLILSCSVSMNDQDLIFSYFVSKKNQDLICIF